MWDRETDWKQTLHWKHESCKPCWPFLLLLLLPKAVVFCWADKLVEKQESSSSVTPFSQRYAVFKVMQNYFKVWPSQ